jgi:arginase family enzyme
VREELDRLTEHSDVFYVDLDVDVVDRAFVPGLSRRPARRAAAA